MEELYKLLHHPISLGRAGVAVLLSLVLGLGIGAGLMRLAIPTTNCTESAEICADFGVFWQAWSLARTRFVDANAAVPDDMITGAVNGMLNTLGDTGHTQFLSADEAEQWRDSLSGEFEGIGAYIDVRDGQAMIVTPMEGSPAERAGLKDNDRIMRVDGVPTEGWDVSQLARAIRGPRGTDVTLSILRAGGVEPFDVTITREALKTKSTQWTLLPNKIAFIHLMSFSEDSGDEFQKAVEEALAAGAQRIVLDLRNNPGGLVYQAVEVAGQFLPKGSVVLLEQARNGERTEVKTERTGDAQTIPLIVLVNQNTASSAEILAGALQDAGRAQVVGMATVGTGTVLTPYTLDGGAELLLGTTQWLTPKGRLIRHNGIAPDAVVDLPLDVEPLSPREATQLTWEALLQGSDVQLVRALELVVGL